MTYRSRPVIMPTMLKERSAIISLALIMGFRMLGLFMILPVFSIYAEKIPGATVLLVGVALGVYGLTQAMLQIPFGMWSDRIGRKPVIMFGLALFFAGSVVAALAHNIEWIIIGRALQGAGAIGSTTLALVSDLTRDENRSKAMAMIGMTIGFAFSVALVLGPVINAWFHLSGIFWCTAGFAIVGMILLGVSVPKPPRIVANGQVGTDSSRLSSVFKNPQLLRLNFGIFSLHATLTALFLTVPMLLLHRLDLSSSQQVLLYLTVLASAFIVVVPLIIVSEKKRRLKSMFTGAIALLIITQFILLAPHHDTLGVAITLFLFFTAFTLLEASLPSLVSKIAPLKGKGTAMGVYSSCQFFGIFIGGVCGGWLFSHYGMMGALLLGVSLCFIWLILAATMAQPPYFSTLLFNVPVTANINSLTEKLSKTAGIAEVAVIAEESLLYLKADKKIITKYELRKLIEEGNLTTP